VYVRLAEAWADRYGEVHPAGEFVDVDIVTLAELEECGVVHNADEPVTCRSFRPDGAVPPGR
jgi:hypothetical protein